MTEQPTPNATPTWQDFVQQLSLLRKDFQDGIEAIRRDLREQRIASREELAEAVAERNALLDALEERMGARVSKVERVGDWLLGTLIVLIATGLIGAFFFLFQGHITIK